LKQQLASIGVLAMLLIGKSSDVLFAFV